jgi:hypothetical protein
MARTDDEREFRLRPPKPRVTRHEGAAWSNGFKLIMHYARSSRKTGNRAPGGKGKAAHPYYQRCAVRVTYLKNKVRGQWKAHGRYLARESATFESDAGPVGFSRESDGVDIAGRLQSWQAAGDQQFWKLIVSPEFGDRVDLARLTRGVIKQIEKDLGTDLEWVAVEHHNTEHPHVHVVIRGVRDSGDVLRLSREFVQQGIRGIAADLCTRQLGYRTELDGAEAERREVTEKRLTSIDRRLLKDAEESSLDLGSQSFTVSRYRRRVAWAKWRSPESGMMLHASPCFTRWALQNHRGRTRGECAGISNRFSGRCSEPPTGNGRWPRTAF